MYHLHAGHFCSDVHRPTAHRQAYHSCFLAYTTALLVSAAHHRSSSRPITHRLCAQQALTRRSGPLPSPSCDRCRMSTAYVAGLGPSAVVGHIQQYRLRRVNHARCRVRSSSLRGVGGPPVRPLRTGTNVDLMSWCEGEAESRHTTCGGDTVASDECAYGHAGPRLPHLCQPCALVAGSAHSGMWRLVTPQRKAVHPHCCVRCCWAYG